MSSTCFVFKAIDETDIDKETNQPRKVALKLMRVKEHFVRELNARRSGFHTQHVTGIYRSHPSCNTTTANTTANVDTSDMDTINNMDAINKLTTSQELLLNHMDSSETMEQTLSIWADEVKDIAVKDAQGV